MRAPLPVTLCYKLSIGYLTESLRVSRIRSFHCHLYQFARDTSDWGDNSLLLVGRTALRARGVD